MGVAVCGEDGSAGGYGGSGDDQVVCPAFRPGAVDVSKQPPVSFGRADDVRLDWESLQELDEELAPRCSVGLGGEFDAQCAVRPP